MLGFTPEASTRKNLEHGSRLLERCSHGSVRQINDWWQDPNMYYAFESRAGAEWMGKHGGPQKFMSMVASTVSTVHEPRRVAHPKCEVKCYSCGGCFESFVKPVDFCIYRCMCTQKVVHVDCFMADACAWCGTKYTKKTCEKKVIKDL